MVLQDCYWCLTNKSRTYFATVFKLYPNVQFVVKADDDV